MKSTFFETVYTRKYKAMLKPLPNPRNTNWEVRCEGYDSQTNERLSEFDGFYYRADLREVKILNQV